MLLFSTRMQRNESGKITGRGWRFERRPARVDLFPGAAYDRLTRTKFFFMITETISHYRVLSQLGGKGSGVAYEAEDLNTGRRVALKWLPPELERDAETRASFERESLAAS